MPKMNNQDGETQSEDVPVGPLSEESSEMSKVIIERLEAYLNSKLEELSSSIANEVALSVVGESYYRYDSTSTYYPTMVFVFKEVNTGPTKRKAQVKARLKHTNAEVTDEVVDKLRAKCYAMRNTIFQYGAVRGNYVSSDKRWKTTVFGADRPSISHLLKSICTCVDEVFEERNLSITTGRNRMNITRRRTPLADIPVNDLDYTVDVKMALYRVVLMVNGLASPIPLVRFTEVEIDLPS